MRTVAPAIAAVAALALAGHALAAAQIGRAHV